MARPRQLMACALVAGLLTLSPALSAQLTFAADASPSQLLPGGGSSAAAAPPCDWAFQGLQCVPAGLMCLRGPNGDVGTFGECFVGQAVTTTGMGTEAISGAPSAPLTLAIGPDADGVAQYIGTILGLSGNGCASGSLGMGAVSVLFDSPQCSVRVTPFFGTGGLTHVQAFASDGSLIAVANGVLPIEVSANGDQRPIVGITLVSDNPGGSGYRLHTRLWNAILEVTAAASSLAEQSLQALLAPLLIPSPAQAAELVHGAGDEVTVQIRLAEPWAPAFNDLSVIAVPPGAMPGGPQDIPWSIQVLDANEDGTLVTAAIHISPDTPAGSYAASMTLWWMGCGEAGAIDAVTLGFPITIQ